MLIDPHKQPGAGSLVVAVHPYKDIEICKRVAIVQSDGRLELSSDNQQVGQDSRHFGPVSPNAIVGVVTHVLARSGPSGR